jgi:hypothetical protein
MDAPPPSRYAFINLPHALTVVGRLVCWFSSPEHAAAFEESRLPDLLAELDRLLRPYPEDPPEPVALPVAVEAAAVARALVNEIETRGFRGDRLGQCVRNLFECLGLGPEGAEHSLLCGERPDSPLRP